MDGAFRVCEYLIEPDLNQISAADCTHQIEPKVMEVLVYLASHAGDVLPKERIIQAVWSDTFVTDDVLMHAISELRKAFGDDAKNPQFIQTIPKRGYRLLVPVTLFNDSGSVTGASAASIRVQSRSKRRILPAAAVALSVAAATLFVWYLGLLPSTPAGSSPSLADDLYHQGFNYLGRYKRADNDAAIDLFKRALEIDPKSARAHAGLATAYGLRAMYFGYPWSMLENAVSEAAKAVQLEPDSPVTHTALANAYRYSGAIGKARHEARRALALHPDYDRALHEMGWLSLFAGRVDEAYSHFRKALQVNPRSASYFVSVSFVYMALELYDEAEDWLQQALAIQNDHILALDILCLVYTQTRRLDRLEDNAQRLTQLDPDMDRGRVRLGQYAYFRSDFHTAREEIERAYQINQVMYGYTYVPILLAQIHLKLGDQETASRLLGQCRRSLESRLEAGGESHQLRLDLAVVSVLEGKPDESLRWLREVVNVGGATMLWTMSFYDMLAEHLGNNREFRRLVQELRVGQEGMREKVAALEKEWNERAPVH